MLDNSFRLILALANAPTATTITKHLQGQADDLITVSSVPNIEAALTTKQVSCIVTDSAFVTLQNNDTFLKQVMLSSTPTLTIIQGAHLSSVFQQVYHPPTHEYVSFPLDLNDLSYLLYVTVAGFRGKSFETTKVAFVQQQLKSMLIQYPSQRVRFTYAAIYASLMHLVDFSKRALSDTKSKQKRLSAFADFLITIKRVAEQIKTQLESSANSDDITVIANLRALNQEITTATSYFSIYRSEIEQYKRDTYEPCYDLPDDAKLITACLGALTGIR